MSELTFQHLLCDKPNAQSIILLHGLFGMSDNLLSLAKSLQVDCHVIVPDLINHGHSNHRKAMTYSDMANDIFTLMDQLNVKEAHVMGHSMGGKVAMQMAANNSHKVLSLTIADIAPVTYPAKHNEIIKGMFAVENADVNTRKEAQSLLAGFVNEAALIQFFMKGMCRGEGDGWQWRFGLHEIHDAYKDICAAPDLSSLFNEPFKKPVLFIKGANSNYITEDSRGVITKAFPKAVLKIIQDTGHWLHAEKPAVFNRLVSNFLTEMST